MSDLLFGKAASPAAGAEPVIETTTRTFMKDVVEPSQTVPVLVDFWAPWCGPCKQLAPLLEAAVARTKGKVRLVKMNIDAHPEVAGQLGIRSIPAVVAFKNGQPLDGFVGALPESQINGFIERLVGPSGPSDAEALVAAADAERAAGAFEAASELYVQALEIEPENLAAVAGLIQATVAAGQVEDARALIDQIPAEKAGDPAIAAARAAVELAEQASGLGDRRALEQAVAADPADHRARFDLAVALAAAGDRLAAVQHLIEIIRQDRGFDDDGARRQLLTFFEAWGAKDPATKEGRRRLSSVLFS